GRLAGGPAAGHHLAGHFRRQQVDRPAEDGDGHQRVAAHGIDVADGIGGGNTPEVEGIVDNGHEEVGGGYHTPLTVNAVHGRIIPRGIADPQGRVESLGAAAGENHVQYPGGNLAAAARSVAV